MALRVMEASHDILRRYPEYPGRERWTERVFYRDLSGTPQPLSTVWNQRVPWIIRPVTGLLQFSVAPSVRAALRLLLSRQLEPSR